MKHASNLSPRLVLIAGAVVVACLLMLAAVAQAAQAHPYERMAEELSQATRGYRALVQEMRPYDSYFHRDPLQPLVDAQGHVVTAVGMHDGLAIQGIIWSDQKPLAIIEDELVAPGAQVGPYTVLQVRADGIVVQYGEDYLLIPLDHGLETPHARPVAFLTLFQDIPIPYTPRRTIIVLDAPTLANK